jgi:hypothetical protein
VVIDDITNDEAGGRVEVMNEVVVGKVDASRATLTLDLDTLSQRFQIPEYVGECSPSKCVLITLPLDLVTRTSIRCKSLDLE